MPEAPAWFNYPLFHIAGQEITAGECVAFAACFGGGMLIGALLQSGRFRQMLVRIGLDKRFVAFVTAFAGLFFLAACLVAGLNLAGIPLGWDAQVPGINISIGGFARMVFLLLLVFWLASAAKRFVFNRFLSQSGLDRSLQFAIAQVLGYAALILGVLIVLQDAGLNLSALAVLAGAIGVGIGFGLQNLASNFISGLVILAERPVKLGDRVDVDGVAGLVTAIRARSTTILTNDNIAMIVPNSKFIENTVTNWSYGDPKVRFRIPVSVAYGTDLERAREVLLGVADAHPDALKTPHPTVFFDGFNDSALKLELVVWSETMSYRPRRFRSDLNFAIDQSFREAGIKIPFPQREVRLRNEKPQQAKKDEVAR